MLGLKFIHVSERGPYWHAQSMIIFLSMQVESTGVALVEGKGNADCGPFIDRIKEELQEKELATSHVIQDLVTVALKEYEGNSDSLVPGRSGPRFNIKMPSYQYRKSHCGDKTVVRSSYLHNGISYTGKMISFYWIRALKTI